MEWNGGMYYGMDSKCTHKLNHVTDALLSLGNA